MSTLLALPFVSSTAVLLCIAFGVRGVGPILFSAFCAAAFHILSSSVL